MVKFDDVAWNDYAKELAFCGNSLLDVIHSTSDAGLVPDFWKLFPDFDEPSIACAVSACKEFAETTVRREEAGEKPAADVAAEFTRLFIGPPKPLAAPWEVFYRPESGQQKVQVGFSKSTFDMKHHLRDAGLELSNDNNRYADHMGIELLLASVYAEHASQGDMQAPDKLDAFVSEHPLRWIDDFAAAVNDFAPKGYYARIVALAKALLLVRRQSCA